MWRSPELEQEFGERLVFGDMRQAAVLRRAGVEHCRAVLLLSQDSQVNLEAALQVRLLNPEAEVVVRASGQEQGLGQLLEQRLPNLAVVNPLMLTAAALAASLHPDAAVTQLTTASGNGSVVLLAGATSQPRARTAGCAPRSTPGNRCTLRCTTGRGGPRPTRGPRSRCPGNGSNAGRDGARCGGAPSAGRWPQPRSC